MRGQSVGSDEREIMDSFELALFYNADAAFDLGALPPPPAPFFKRGWVGKEGGS